MARPDAAQRLVENILRVLDRTKDAPRQYRKLQKGIADATGIKPATVSETLKRRNNTTFRLVHLDKIADYLGVTPSDLIRHAHSALWELTPEETRLVRHYREWPTDVQDRVMALFDFFAGMLPEEKEQRRLWTKWRRLKPQDRAYVERAIDDVLRAAKGDAPDTTAFGAAVEGNGENTLPSGPPGPRKVR